MGRHNHLQRNGQKKDFRDHYDIAQRFLPDYARYRYILCDEYHAGVENMAAPPWVREVYHMRPGPRWEQIYDGD